MSQPEYTYAKVLYNPPFTISVLQKFDWLRQVTWVMKFETGCEFPIA